ncbi:NAD(P)-binding protein [Mycena galopus ATCC 62051]|nr:NAD(P)-binding protein [Mycena galopus ATCC 62051]
MTITHDTSAPLIAVVGATGIQGGSVVRALAESDQPYRVRGFTRDATKPAAQALAKLGVAIMAVSLGVDNKDQVYHAFAGADFAFLVTNPWEPGHLDADREVAEGKLMIDAAKAGGVAGIVWSGLRSITALSGGKYTHVWHFDGKAAITAYGRAAGVPFVEVQAGTYGSNFLAAMAPTKQADGSFVLAWPASSLSVLPVIDAVRDYGLFVRYVLELPVFPDGAEFLAYGENVSLQDMVLELSKVTGKNVLFTQITEEQYKQGLQSANLPPHVIEALYEVLSAFGEFDC